MNSNFDKLFDQDFDISEPKIGHFDRFEKKLLNPTNKVRKLQNSNWKWISIAASVVLIFGIYIGQISSIDTLELADVSPKMEETQDYFTALIRTEIEKVNAERSDENKKLIDDAFHRLDKLESNYSELTFELKMSNADKRVIFAMISNFQQRIEVLQNLLEQIDNNKQLKITNYENYS